MKTSQDLTLVLIRGNGAPRTFNLPLPKLKRSLILLMVLVLSLTVACIALAVLNLTSSRAKPLEVPVVSETDKQKIENSSELQAELEKLQALLEGRKKLPADPKVKNDAPINLLGPISTLVSDPPVLINRPMIRRHENSQDITVEFELQNRSPNQNRIRGYIVVLAKTPNGIFSYPEGAFSMDDNILLNFAKGETFGISRARGTVATFSDMPKERGKVSFQVFIFSSSGQILNTLHVPDQS